MAHRPTRRSCRPAVFFLLMFSFLTAAPSTGADEYPFVAGVREELDRYRRVPDPNFYLASKVMGELLNIINAAASMDDQAVAYETFVLIREYVDSLPLESRGVMAGAVGSMAEVLVSRDEWAAEGLEWYAGAWEDLDAAMEASHEDPRLWSSPVFLLSHQGALIHEHQADHARDPAEVRRQIALGQEMVDKRQVQVAVMAELYGETAYTRRMTFEAPAFEPVVPDQAWYMDGSLPVFVGAGLEFARGATGIVRHGNRLEFAVAEDLQQAFGDQRPVDAAFVPACHPLNHMRLLWTETDGERRSCRPVTDVVLPRILPPNWVAEREEPNMRLDDLAWDRFDDLSARVASAESAAAGGSFRALAVNLVCLPDPLPPSSGRDLAWFVIVGDTALRVTRLTPGADFMLRYLRSENLPLIGGWSFAGIEKDGAARAVDHPGLGHIVGDLNLIYIMVASSFVQGSPLEIDGIKELEQEIWSVGADHEADILHPGALAELPAEDLSRAVRPIMAATDSLAMRAYNETCGWYSQPRLAEMPDIELPTGVDPGLVVLRLLVGEDGEMTGPRVMYTTNPELEAAAFAAMQACRFEPVCEGTDRVREGWAYLMLAFRNP